MGEFPSPSTHSFPLLLHSVPRDFIARLPWPVAQDLQFPRNRGGTTNQHVVVTAKFHHYPFRCGGFWLALRSYAFRMLHIPEPYFGSGAGGDSPRPRSQKEFQPH